MRTSQSRARPNFPLAIGLWCGFVLLAVVWPVFFVQPHHVVEQVAVSVVAFGSFTVLAALHLGPQHRISIWVVGAVFVIGYGVLLVIASDDFRPDQHWFFLSPVGYVSGALAFGDTTPKASRGRQRSEPRGVRVECWSSTGKLDPPTRAPEHVVKQLDGRRLSLVRLVKGACALELGGGAKDRFVVYYSDDRTDDGSWFVYKGTSVSAERDEEECLMFVADVEGYIPEKYWCTPAQVQDLAEEFTKNGRIETSRDGNWENPGPMAGGMRPSMPTEY